MIMHFFQPNTKGLMGWGHYKHLIYFKFHTPEQIRHDSSAPRVFMFIQVHYKYCKIPELIPSVCGFIQHGWNRRLCSTEPYKREEAGIFLGSGPRICMYERVMMSGCTFMAKSHKSAISPCSITTVPGRQNSQHPKEDQIFHTAMCRRDTDTFLESLVLMDERRSGFVIQVRANATGQGGAAKLRNYMCRWSEEHSSHEETHCCYLRQLHPHLLYADAHFSHSWRGALYEDRFTVASLDRWHVACFKEVQVLSISFLVAWGICLSNHHHRVEQWWLLDMMINKQWWSCWEWSYSWNIHILLSLARLDVR